MTERPTFQLRALEPTHGQMLDAALQLLARHPRVAWARKFNTGAHVIETADRRGRTGRRFVRYAFPGCADILGQLADGRFLAVEIKVKRDRASEEQKQFLNLVNRNGGIAFIARSPEDIIDRLREDNEREPE